ncbi:hypothetical protein XHV734_2130 [Xanthomonas hortorum pv. vitians]|nr:hypothetical protein XHV734_2130 [Xanthomonas hortorum pv. vitians]
MRFDTHHDTPHITCHHDTGSSALPARVIVNLLQRSPKRLFISQHIGAGKRYRAVMPTC